MSDLVRNPEDRFSHDVAHIDFTSVILLENLSLKVYVQSRFKLNQSAQLQKVAGDFEGSKVDMLCQTDTTRTKKTLDNEMGSWPLLEHLPDNQRPFRPKFLFVQYQYERSA